MNRGRSTLLAVGILALLVIGTFPALVRAVTPPGTTPAPEGSAEALFEKAEAYYRNNFMTKALEQYKLVVERFPHSPQAPPAMYQIGQIYLRTNSFEEALFYFRLLTSEHADHPMAVEAYFEMGVCQQKLKQHDRAVQAFGYYVNVQGAKRPDEAKILLGDSYVALQQYPKALIAYGSCRPDLDNDQQVELLKKVRDLLSDKISLDELLTLIPRLNEGPVADFSRYRAAEQLMYGGRRTEAVRLLREIKYTNRKYKFYAKAEELLQRALGAGPTPPAAGAVESFTGNEPISEGPACAIGLLLPLSGDAGVFGREVLHGVMLGAGLFGDQNPSACRMIVRDTRGDPATAAQAVNELADNPEVLAIIGPLLGKTATAAVEAAEKRAIPLIALSPRETLAEEGRWAFRNFLTASDQARTLVRYAVEQQNATRFAILYPEDEQGRHFVDVFRRAVAGTRGRVVAAVGYAPDETDFRYPIGQLRSGGKFDALFIPDNYRRVALLAPQLVYYEVKNVMLLGINRWNNDELARTANAYLSRAVFVDGFFARAANTEVDPFVSMFRNEYGQEPSFLSAVGFDTVRLLQRILSRPGARGREKIRTELMSLDAFAGVTGELSMGEDRNVRRRLYLLRVGPNGIEELY